MCSANKMESIYVWIITLLAHSLIATSSNVGRQKRDLVFFKTLKANIFGYNTNNAIITNENNIKILYPVPNYQVLMNRMTDPYVRQNMYKETFPKLVIPGNVVMQPVINFGRLYVPYIRAFNGRNYKAAYANFLPVNENMQKVIPLPNYISVGVPSVRCNNKIPVLYKKSIFKDKTGKVSSDFNKHVSHKLPEFHNYRDAEEISREVDEQSVSSQPPQPKNIRETPNTTPPVTVKKIQSNKTSTISPNSTVHLGLTKLSKHLRISTSTQSYSTNAQELITSHVVTIGPTLITSPRPTPLPVKNVQRVELLRPIPLPHEKKNEEIKPTSAFPAYNIQSNNKDEISNNFHPHNHATNIETTTSGKPKEGASLKKENVKYPKNTESPGDLMVQPSIFSNVIDVTNGIAPRKEEVTGKEKQLIYIPQESDEMEVYNQSTDAYPSYSEEFDYLKSSPIIVEPSGSVQEGSQNKPNGSEQGVWFLPNDSDREISRGDIPDL